MARLKAKNMAATTLTADITSEATSFGVQDASALPDCPFRVMIFSPQPQAAGGEIVEVGAKDTATNTVSQVQRGLEGTTASSHSAGDYVEARWTAEMYNELETEAGAQAKANAAENAAKTYVDDKVLTEVPANAVFTDTVTEVVDNLTSTDANKALSANQGKVLKDAQDTHEINTAIHTKIIAIEEGTTEPTAENGALLVIYEAVV